MTTQTVAGLFDDDDAARQAIEDLEVAGIPHDSISMVANNADSRWSSASIQSVEGGHRGTATGASIGAILGAGAGLLAGLGMVAIPGLGPVVAAGWLAATVTGAVAGAAAGGIVGALTDAGISRDHAHVFAEAVRRGGTLVVARVEDTFVAMVQSILARNGAIDPESRAADYRNRGWTEFDESAPPYSAADIDRDRTRYIDRLRF